jgi:ABC-type multidrug transport system ATPase subunit
MMSEVLRVTALRKVVGRKTLLNQVDLTVNSGEIVGLIGPNGAGKTTFLKIISC